jgi:hypothetical protein
MVSSRRRRRLEADTYAQEPACGLIAATASCEKHRQQIACYRVGFDLIVRRWQSFLVIWGKEKYKLRKEAVEEKKNYAKG